MIRALFIITTCLGLMPDAALAAGDIVAGEKVFQKCNGCHEGTLGATKKAPTLRGVVGRPVASVDGFAYSDGLKAFAATGAVWDGPTLDKFLQDPNGFVKGMRMLMTPIHRETDRVNLIAFLKSNM
jgi:cytochrome c